MSCTESRRLPLCWTARPWPASLWGPTASSCPKCRWTAPVPMTVMPVMPRGVSRLPMRNIPLNTTAAANSGWTSWTTTNPLSACSVRWPPSMSAHGKFRRWMRSALWRSALLPLGRKHWVLWWKRTSPLPTNRWHCWMRRKKSSTRRRYLRRVVFFSAPVIFMPSSKGIPPSPAAWMWRRIPAVSTAECCCWMV